MNDESGSKKSSDHGPAGASLRSLKPWTRPEVIGSTFASAGGGKPGAGEGQVPRSRKTGSTLTGAS